MAISIGVAKLQNGAKAIVLETQPEFWPDVAGMLRMLKSQFPEEYRSVWYEVLPANGKRFESPLVLPEGVSNGRREVRDVGCAGDGSESGGGSGDGGADGSGDVSAQV